MNRILAQSRKELAQFWRDRLTVALAFVLPLLTLLIFGFAIRLETDAIPLAIQDFERSPLSRAYIERLLATNQFEIAPLPRSPGPDRPNPAIAAIDQGRAKATVVIPPNFSRQLLSQPSVAVQVLVDGTDVNNARVIANGIRATTNFFLQVGALPPVNPLPRGNEASNPPSPAQGQVDPQIRIWFNPGRQESLYIVPGAFAVILWIYPSLLAALAMVREKEQGTLVQVYASSLRATELLLGKGLAYFLVGLAETLFIVVLSGFLFRLRLAGDPTPLLVSIPLYLATSVLFGLLIGVRTTTQNAAVQAVATIGFLSALLLSGFIYPVSNIPFPLSLIPNILPARYFMLVTRDAFVRGTGWPGVWFVPLVLALLGFLLFQATWRGLRPMQLSD